MAAYQYVLRSGRSVPDDVSIMGYSNFKQSEIFYGGLTTIAMPTYEMGEKAAGMILEYSAGNREALGQIVMDVQLVERQSVQAKPV